MIIVGSEDWPKRLPQSPTSASATPSLHLLLSFAFLFLTPPPPPPTPSVEMVRPSRSKQALITPSEGIVWGTAHSVWRGPRRGTWEQEIDAAGVWGAVAPSGKCTAPADGVSLSTLGKCVKDGERRRSCGWTNLQWSGALGSLVCDNTTEFQLEFQVRSELISRSWQREIESWSSSPNHQGKNHSHFSSSYKIKMWRCFWSSWKRTKIEKILWFKMLQRFGILFNTRSKMERNIFVFYLGRFLIN